MVIHPIAKIARILLAVLLIFGLAQFARAGNNWSLKDKDGKHYQLSSLKGKWVLVNFWAPWCPPCLQEMPEFSALQKEHENLQVIGIAVMYRKKQDVLKIVQKKSISYPIVLGNEDIASEFGEIEGLPTSYLYAPSGKLVGQHQGPLTRSEVEAVMQQKSGAAAGFTP